MDGFLYRGEYTLQTQAPGGTFYVTIAGAKEVKITQNAGAATIFRLYGKPYNSGMWPFQARLLTRPIKDGEHEYSFHVIFRWNADGSGTGFLESFPTRTSELFIAGNIDGSQRTLDVKYNDDRLGVTAGRFPPEDRFYRYSGSGLFGPSPWTFRPVDVPPFNGKDQRILDFSGDAITIVMQNCQLKGSRFPNARLQTSDFTGSTFNSCLCNPATFGDGTQSATLNRTVWKDAGLSNANFTGCQLESADFREGWFNFPDPMPWPYPGIGPAIFKGANLRNADFRGCDIRGAIFQDADLTGAKFNDAKMHKVDLTNATLIGVDFTNTNLTTVVFGAQRPKFHNGTPAAATPKAKFLNATLNADLLGKDWSCLDLEGSTLQQIPSDLTDLKATFSNLTAIGLEGRNLTRADFKMSNLTRTKLNSAKLIDADLAGLNLTATEFRGAEFSGTHLERADLSKLDLTSVTVAKPALGSTDPQNRTKLRESRINAGLFGTRWVALDLTDAVIGQLDRTDLTGMQADDAILTRVTLIDANFNPRGTGDQAQKSAFRRVLFHGANLTQTQFLNADLQGAQFGKYKPVHRVENARPGMDWQVILKESGFRLPPGAVLTADEGEHHALLQANTQGKTILLVRRETRAEGHQELLVLAEDKPANISKAYFAGANLKNANLEAAIANNAHIYSSTSSVSQLEGAVMTNIRLSGANLGSVNLTKADLRGANLQGANLVDANLGGAKLSPFNNGAETFVSDLSRAHISGAKFPEATLVGAIFTDAAVPTESGVYLFSGDPAIRAELTAYKKVRPGKPADFNRNLAMLKKPDKPAIAEFLIEAGLPIDEIDSVTPVDSQVMEWTVEAGAGTEKKAYPVALDLTGNVVVLKAGDKLFPEGYDTIALTGLRQKRGDLLKEAFSKIGITLAGNVTVTDAVTANNRWRVVSKSRQTVYVWTSAFDPGTKAFSAETSWDQTRSLFETKGYPLSIRASLTADAGAWRADNDSANPMAFAPGYVAFSMKAENEGVAVFATSFRISRLGKDNRLDILTVSLKRPGDFDRKIMDGDTVMPNGRSLKNLGEGWSDLWLRTTNPPAPPKCVPGKDGYCPRE